MQSKVLFLGISIIIFLLIVLWPIYFFSMSVFGFIPLALNELLVLGLVEISLIVILIIFWEFYKRHYKK